jgi:hypothetical protein
MEIIRQIFNYSKNHTRVWQLNKMMPKREKVELAHLYFVPKPHKEIQFISVSIFQSSLFEYPLCILW